MTIIDHDVFKVFLENEETNDMEIKIPLIIKNQDTNIYYLALYDLEKT